MSGSAQLAQLVEPKAYVLKLYRGGRLLNAFPGFITSIRLLLASSQQLLHLKQVSDKKSP